MEFVDNTGHIFSLPSYKEKPIGYEYDEQQYIFWMDSNESHLSINNYYSRPIYILYELQNDYSLDELQDDENSPIQISIKLENSNVFSFISPKEINNLINSDNYKNLNDYIQLNTLIDNEETSTLIKSSLSNTDLIVYKTQESKIQKIKEGDDLIDFNITLNYLLIPIYPISYANEEGTWISNILIHISDKNKNIDEWCPISIGGEFINEYEELIINGKNIGINLPKDILKSVYSESLYNNEFNESLYNEKLKEYLINVISIRHECGNFKSAINSLKWFGYGDKLTISKLLKTDNDLKDQYILDYFNISNDIIDSFKTFYTDSLLSLKLFINKELDELNKFDFSKDFWGENKPKSLSLIDYNEKIKVGQHTIIDDKDEIYYYWKPYFDFSFTELGVKLMCLKYFYKKYFLPIHLYLHSVGLAYRVYANDIKMTSTIGSSISMPSISLNCKPNEVEFNKNNEYYFTKQIHYIDDKFNEYSYFDIDNCNKLWYKINDTCVNIPIKFINNEINKGYFNCVLILQNKNNEVLYESQFSFLQYDNNHRSIKYNNFIIYPKKLNRYIQKSNDEIKLKSNYFEYWVNNEFIIKLLVNNKWYEYEFKLKIHNPTIDFGTLNYRYYFNDHNYLLSKLDNNINTHFLIYTNEIDKIKSNIGSLNAFDINENDANTINDYLLRNFELNENESFVNVINIYDDLYKAYEYYKDNNEYKYAMKKDDYIDKVTSYQYGMNLYYNILSPFTQIKSINDDYSISFNSYMHNVSLVNVNNIDFDVDFYKILQYHLDHNLLYIDGTLVNKSFNQYILYKFTDENDNEREIEIFINKDLIGYDIEIPYEYLNKNNIVVCAWNDNLYILTEYGDNNKSFFINTLSSLNEIIVSENDDNDSYALLFDSVNLYYDKLSNSYYTNDNNNNKKTYYYIYDKLYNNLDYLNNNYLSEINIPNSNKYKNQLHLFNIYTSNIEEKNILYFHNDLNVYLDGLYFTHDKYINSNDETVNYESSKIYITGVNTDNDIDSRYISIYGLHWIDLKDNESLKYIPKEYKDHLNEYGFYVKRDYKQFYEPAYESQRVNHIYELNDLFEFDDNEFTYYTENSKTLAAIYYYNTLNDFYNHNFIEDKVVKYVDCNIQYDETNNGNKKFYFYDNDVKDIYNKTKQYKNKLYYSIAFINQNNEEISINLNNINNNEYDKIKVTFLYNKTHVIRNRFYTLAEYIRKNNDYIYEFINDNTLSIKQNNYSESIIVNLKKLSPKYFYENQIDNTIIPNGNPSMYWYNVDENNIISLPSYLNELERYVYNNEVESVDDIISKLDEYKAKYINNVFDDSLEARYHYNNYLSKDMTGLSGTYRLRLEHNFGENVVMLCAEIIDNDGNISLYNSLNNNKFTLNGNERKVTLYVKINLSYNKFNSNWIIPQLIEINQIDKQLEYNAEECGNDMITIKLLNKEFTYGNNKSKFIYDLYNDFFKLKTNIYDFYIEDNEFKYNLLYSVYEVNQSLNINKYFNYDFYLMHDDQYWYGLYISKDTCNMIEKQSNLEVPIEYNEMNLIGKINNYKLKYVKSSKEYLINRLEFISSNGYNHFKNDDIVACYIHNNDRLPFNPYISSKWSISPMSLGMTTDSKFESNAEMTILSIPKNDNKYQKGYYKVTVKYSLDRDIQHQFKNTSTIRIS